LTRIAKKLFYYSDIKLLSEAFCTSILIFIKIHLFGCKDFVLLSNIPLGRFNLREKTKVTRYCQFSMRLMRLFGLRDTCLTYSVLLCRMLRRSGLDARVNFGAVKEDGGLIGHCWVTVGDERADPSFKLIFEYP
jgi:hypothetical protein